MKSNYVLNIKLHHCSKNYKLVQIKIKFQYETYKKKIKTNHAMKEKYNKI